MNEVLTYSEKDHFLQTLEREFETTVKVLKAYPEDKLDLKPAEISKSAKYLIWTFVMEQALTEKVLNPNPEFGTKAPEPMGDLKQIISTYEKMFQENLIKLKELPESEYNGMTKWFKSGKPTDMRRMDVLNIFLFDMIHHRGQLSVYLRMAGGRLPNIYGPVYEDSLKK